MKKKFAHILYDLKKNADVSKNFQTRFLINAKSYKAEISSKCSLGNYLCFVISNFEKKTFLDFMAKNLFFPFFDVTKKHMT